MYQLQLALDTFVHGKMLTFKLLIPKPLTCLVCKKKKKKSFLLIMALDNPDSRVLFWLLLPFRDGAKTEKVVTLMQLNKPNVLGMTVHSSVDFFSLKSMVLKLTFRRKR